MTTMEHEPLSITTVSSKYQVAIPKEIRVAAKIVPGTRFVVVPTESGLRLIRLRPLIELSGSVPPDPAAGIRDKEDRS